LCSRSATPLKATSWKASECLRSTLLKCCSTAALTWCSTEQIRDKGTDLSRPKPRFAKADLSGASAVQDRGPFFPLSEPCHARRDLCSSLDRRQRPGP